jgi:DNA-binding PadR family transcriptional regulator
MYEAQKKYSKTEKGRKALKKARKKYDESDAERRRRQKREYMRRKRLEEPACWRHKNA